MHAGKEGKLKKKRYLPIDKVGKGCYITYGNNR